MNKLLNEEDKFFVGFKLIIFEFNLEKINS